MKDPARRVYQGKKFKLSALLLQCVTRDTVSFRFRSSCSLQWSATAGGWWRRDMAEAQTSNEVHEGTAMLSFEGENGPQDTQAPPRVDSVDKTTMPLPESCPKMQCSNRQVVSSRAKQHDSADQDQVGWSNPRTKSVDRLWSELYQQTPTLPFEEQNSPQCQKQSRPVSLPTTEVATSSLEEVTLAEVAQNNNTLQLFVAQVAERLLRECNAPCDHNREAWLTERTIGGLADLADGFCLPRKSAGTICQAVRKDLQQTFWSKHQLDTLVLMEHPAVDSVIVQCLQAHIRSMSAAQVAKEAKDARRPPCFWRFVPPMLVFAAVVGTLWLLVIFLPL